MKNRFSDKGFFGVVRRELAFSSYGFYEVEHSPAARVTAHTHEIPHFIFVVRGVYSAAIKKDEIACRPTTMLFHPADTTHRDRFISPGGQLFAISLEAGNLAQISELGVSLKNQTVKLHRAEIFDLGTKMLNELRFSDDLTPMVLEGMTNELLAYVLRRLEKADEKFPPWLKLARELIRDRCTEKLTIAEIAHAVRIHPVHLNRAFRRHFRCSPGEYLRKCRIEYASDRLKNSGLPLAEIALLSGFSDQSHFTKSFRLETGLTPGKFRQIFG